MIIELILEALQTLRSNWVRTILTMIGIILGVGAVVAIMNLGQSAYLTAEEAIRGSGYGSITIKSSYGKSTMPLNQSLITALKSEQIEGVEDFEPKFNSFGNAVFNSDDDSVSVIGHYSGINEVEKLTYLAGYSYDEDDILGQSFVVEVDDYIANELFGSAANALGELLRFNDGNFYRIIGVFQSEDRFKKEYGEVHLPVSLGELSPQFQTFGYDSIGVNTKMGVDYEKVSDEIKTAIMNIYGFEDDEEMSFQIENVREIMAEVSTFMTAFSIGLSLIAAISLLVGGVGIMNIMLVNVTERTKEIGLMKSLGAQEKDITFQFLVEAIVMTVFGGLIGVALGIGFSGLIIFLANTFGQGFLPKFTFSVDQKSILISLLVSTIIGLIFGAYPAKKAAKLDPVEALRRD